MSIPLLDGVVAVAYPFVAGLATLLSPVGGAAVAIVLCTAVLRLLLLPLTLAAVRGERARAALAPQVTALRQQHAKDPARLGTELAGLYRGAGVSPFAGFLPLLAQAPFFMVWYRIFTASEVAGHANALVAQQFLGAALSVHLFGGHPLAFVPLLLVLFALAVVSVRRIRRVAALAGTPAPGGVLVLLPFASLLSALVMPLAAVVYLCTTLAWTAVENVLLRRGLPAEPVSPAGSR